MCNKNNAELCTSLKGLCLCDLAVYAMPCCASIHKLHTGTAFCIGSPTQVMEVA